jgi:hypothetical protein
MSRTWRGTRWREVDLGLCNEHLATTSIVVAIVMGMMKDWYLCTKCLWKQRGIPDEAIYTGDRLMCPECLSEVERLT